MIRTLNLLITVLHTASDIRRRVTLPATAALLTITATLIVARTVTADSGHIPVAMTQKTATTAGPLRPVDALPPALQPKEPSDLDPKHVIAHVDQTQANTAALSSNGTEEAPPVTVQAIDGSSSTNSASTPPATSSPGATLQVAAPQFTCSNGQRRMSIASAQLTLAASPATTDTGITWYWETRVDTGAPDALPVTTQQHVDTIPAGQASGFLTSPDGQAMLLTAPEASDYAYSVRLHTTEPFDVTSEWISVPEAASSCM